MSRGVHCRTELNVHDLDRVHEDINKVEIVNTQAPVTRACFRSRNLFMWTSHEKLFAGYGFILDALSLKLRVAKRAHWQTGPALAG